MPADTSKRLPVLAGVGQVVQRTLGERDLLGLLRTAADRAAADAGAPGLLATTEVVYVPEGTWSPANPAAALVPGARTVLARIGVLQTTPIARACEAIAAGAIDVALVVGGEARASERAGLTGVELPAGPADEEWAPHGEIVTAVEIERGLAVPVQSYAVQESALGKSEAELDDLWDRFAAVAASNPCAWDPEPAGGDRMISTPYRRRHVSQWNVDMAVALLLCSTAAADAHGVPAGRRVHPHAVVESNAMIPVSERADLWRSPAVGVIGRHLGDVSTVQHLDLYSCFPSAVRIQAAELGIGLDRQLTVTGGMAFGGGPLNSAALHAMASMADVLRADPGSSGLVTAVSGMLTKVGASVWSTAPPPSGAVRVEDVAGEARAETATVEVDPAYRGDAVVEAVTVAHDRNGPSLAVVLARTPGGRRAVATGAPGAARPVGELVRLDGPALLG